MDFETLLNFISTNGFAIVCCIYMMTTCNKTVQENSKCLQELSLLIKNFLDKEGKENK